MTAAVSSAALSSKSASLMITVVSNEDNAPATVKLPGAEFPTNLHEWHSNRPPSVKAQPPDPLTAVEFKQSRRRAVTLDFRKMKAPPGSFELVFVAVRKEKVELSMAMVEFSHRYLLHCFPSSS